MSYYNYNALFPPGQAQDRVRGSRLPDVGPTLNTLEEAFTSENWIIRIYKVKDLDNIGRTMPLPPHLSEDTRRRRTPRRGGPAFSGLSRQV